jgi:hypothetical protein
VLCRLRALFDLELLVMSAAALLWPLKLYIAVRGLLGRS